MKRPWNVAWGNSSSWSCRDDKEMCQTVCCTCELDVLPFAYQTYSDFSDVLVAVAVAVGLAKAPHGWPLNWAPFQMNIVWCAFSITKKTHALPLKKKKTRHITTCEDSLFLSSLKKRRKGDSAWIASNLWSRRSPNFWTRQSCFFSSNWFSNSSEFVEIIRLLERLSITFTSNGKREFVPRD